MSTIDDKLNDLSDIKTALREAINFAYNKDKSTPVVIVNNVMGFAMYADIIRDNLCATQTPTYSVKVSKKDSEYTVPTTALVNGSSVTGTVSGGYCIFSGIEAGSTVVIRGVAAKTGYTVSGVTPSTVSYSDGTITVSSMPSSDLTITVKSAANEYTVTYNTVGGTATPTPFQISFKATADLADYQHEKTEGGITYQSNGWIKTYGTERTYTNGGSYTQEDAHDITLYTIWQEVQPQSSYYWALVPPPYDPAPTVDIQENSTSNTEVELPITTSAVLILACVPTAVSGARFRYKFGGEPQYENLVDLVGSRYETKVDVDNIPSGYKCLVYGINRGADGYTEPYLLIDNN